MSTYVTPISSTFSPYRSHGVTNLWRMPNLSAIEFAEAHSLLGRSNMYPHENIHKDTWISPGNETKKQIDQY